MNWTVRSPAPVAGGLDVPGDKSISHRVAMIAAISRGVSRLSGFLDSEDCLGTLDALQALGVAVERSGGAVTVTGAQGCLRSPGRDLDLGNSGTGLRLMTGLLAGQQVQARLTGDASLRSRPMARILEPLARMGADVRAEGAEGRAPLVVHPAPLQGIAYRLPVASAQVKSCLLLAGLRATGVVELTEPAPSRDHTERLLRAVGAALEQDGLTVRLRGSGGLPFAPPARDWSVPGDLSSAAFWLVAAALRPGGRVTVRNLGLNPSRTAFLDALRAMGAEVRVGPVREGDWEPQADVTVLGGAPLHGIELGGRAIPNLIDEIPVLAVAASFAVGPTRIRDAAELRVKESDRIESTAAMLRAVGLPVDTRPDGLDIPGGGSARPGVVTSRGDHRIAMSGATIALATGVPVTIEDVGCVGTSYPQFADHLEHLAPGALQRTP